MTKPLEELVFLVEESAEGGFTARALGVSIVTEADSLEMLRQQVVDAVRCHFEDISHQPRLIRFHLVKDEVFAL